MDKVLFFHGGPGLNGNPERCMLTELYKQQGFELVCWDEPSALRPEEYPFKEDDAFANYLKSADSFLTEQYNGESLTLIAYCFASQLLSFLLDKHADKIKLIVVISPDFNLNLSDSNIFTFTAHDFHLNHDERSADELLRIKDNYKQPFDDNTIKGWEIALSNPRLFNYYWRNQELKQKYLQHYAENYHVDAHSFFSVRKSCPDTLLKVYDLPVLVLYGKYDGIVSVQKELELMHQYFNHMKVVELEQSGHYPHIEEAEKVLGLIQTELTALMV